MGLDVLRSLGLFSKLYVPFIQLEGFRIGGFEAYLSSSLGNQRLTFGSLLGLCRGYSTPKRLKVTYSTARG